MPFTLSRAKKAIYCLLFSLLLIGCCRNNTFNTDRLTGPQIATQLNSSTIAMVDNYGDVNSPYCGGVWVGQNTILTAAHCVVGEANMERQWLVARELVELGAPSDIAMQLAQMDVNDLDDNDHSPPADAIRTANAMFPAFNPLTFTYYYSNFDEQGEIGHSPHRKHAMSCIALFSDTDLAILKVSGPVSQHSIVSLANNSPLIGSPLFSVGQSHGNWFSYKEYSVSAYRKTMRIDLQGPFMQVSGHMIGGDSGSGIFNENGELVGISSFITLDSGFGYAVTLSHIRQVLLGQHLIVGHIDEQAHDPDLDATLP